MSNQVNPIDRRLDTATRYMGWFIKIGLWVVALFCLLIFTGNGGGFIWPAFDQSPELKEIVQVLMVFFAMTVVIERAGQVVILAMFKDEKAKVKKDVVVARKLYASTTEAQSESQSQGFNKLSSSRKLMAVRALGKPISKQSDLDAGVEAKKEELDKKKEKVKEIEKKEDRTSILVTLPLAMIISLSGIRMLEQLYPVSDLTCHMDTNYCATDAAKKASLDHSKYTSKLEALENKLENPAEGVKPETIEKQIKNLKSENKTVIQMKTRLKMFKFTDLIFSILILAGGSAGIRRILKIFNDKIDGDSDVADA